MTKTKFEFMGSDVSFGVRRGEIEGAIVRHVFSRNTNVPITITDINVITTDVEPNVTGDQIFLVSDGGPIDIGVQVNVSGLDIDHNLVEEIITLDGTGLGISTRNDFMWINKAEIVGNVGLRGNLNVDLGPAQWTQILPEYQQTFIAVAGIPKGYTGYIMDTSSYTNKNKDCTIIYQFKEDKAQNYWKTVSVSDVYQAQTYEDYNFAPIKENSFLKMQCYTSAGGSGVTVSANFTILLIPNTYGESSIVNN